MSEYTPAQARRDAEVLLKTMNAVIVGADQPLVSKDGLIAYLFRGHIGKKVGPKSAPRVVILVHPDGSYEPARIIGSSERKTIRAMVKRNATRTAPKDLRPFTREEIAMATAAAERPIVEVRAELDALGVDTDRIAAKIQERLDLGAREVEMTMGCRVEEPPRCALCDPDCKCGDLKALDPIIDNGVSNRMVIEGLGLKGEDLS